MTARHIIVVASAAIIALLLVALGTSPWLAIFFVVVGIASALLVLRRRAG